MSFDQAEDPAEEERGGAEGGSHCHGQKMLVRETVCYGPVAR